MDALRALANAADSPARLVLIVGRKCNRQQRANRLDLVLTSMRIDEGEVESLESVVRRYGIPVRKSGGSHFVFLHPDSDIAVTVRFRCPIKPVYISQFLALVDDKRSCLCGSGSAPTRDKSLAEVDALPREVILSRRHGDEVA